MDVHSWDDEPVEWLNPAIGRQVLDTERMTVARLVLKAGAVVPEHNHEHEQVANALEGRLRFRIGEEEREVGPGESVVVPSNAPHEVIVIEDAVVLEMFSRPRDDWQRGEDSYLRE